MSDSQLLLDISGDLKRVALGLHRGALSMADKFTREARHKLSRLNKNEKNIHRLVTDLEEILNHTKLNIRAEGALMYSNLFRHRGLRD
jgi:hypothetical protein